MNTNSNVYTIVYTTVVCVLVAAILAFVSQSLKPMQVANEKAETISQILAAAQFEEQADNNAILNFYKQNISEAILVNADGKKVGSLNTADAQVYSTADLKAQNYNIKDGSACSLPVYIFKNGISVIPVYGAGLWGPVWGYVALDGLNIVGAYFDHSGETPGHTSFRYREGRCSCRKGQRHRCHLWCHYDLQGSQRGYQCLGSRLQELSQKSGGLSNGKI